MEMWDVLDREGKKIGKEVIRQQAIFENALGEGEYHLSVEVFILNSKGEILLTRRSPNKDVYGGYWETTAGSVIAGEESLETMLREIKEEIGIEVKDWELIFQKRIVEEIRHQFMDLYYLEKDISLDEIVFQEGETCDARWVDFDWKILDDEGIVPQMRERMRFIWFDLMKYKDIILR